MKKQFLLLFAASALFAACSSDEMPNSNEVNNGQEQTEIENYPSSYAVTTTEGIGMSVGALSNEDVNTKADGDDQVYFTIELPTDVLREWDSYVLKADDFAIRVDGVYLDLQREEGSDHLSDATGKVLIRRTDKLAVQAEGLEKIDYAGENRHEVSFEAYLWIENQIEQETENGLTTVERFTYKDKLDWIGLDWQGDDNMTAENERGWDATEWVSNENGAQLHSKKAPDEGQPEFGYGVRYNVYRGLQGRPINEDGEEDPVKGLGDTPYFKISIHVNRLADDVKTQIVPIIPGK